MSESTRCAARTTRINRSRKSNRAGRRFEQLEQRLPLASDDTLSPFAPSGDVDGDGYVNQQDLSILLSHFGKPSAARRQDGDLNQDGRVDFSDFLVLADNFGETRSAASPVQTASVADRVIDSVGYDDFKLATSLPAESPALAQAVATDLIVEIAGLHSPATMTAVVLKPRSSTSVYAIPVPDAAANTYDFLHSHLDAARQQDADVIRFPPSHHFYVTPPIPIEDQPRGALEAEAHLNIRGFTDVTLDFNGSTIQFQDKALGIRVEDSSRVILRNGTVIGQGLLSTIARVEPDTTEAGIRLEVLPEFQGELEATWNGVPDLRTVGTAEQDGEGNWRIKAEGYAELFTNRGRPHNNFTYVDGSFIATDPLINGESPFVSGVDHVWLLHENNSAHGVLLDNELGIQDITVEDMVFMNIPGMVVVGEIQRGLHLNRVSFQSEPGAPFLGASSDTVHINANGGDIVIEDSFFGPSGDDKITIKGNYWEVTDVDLATNTLTVEPVENGTSVSRWGWAGEKVVFVGDDFSVVGEATLASDSIRDTETGNHHLVRLQSIPAGVGVHSILGNVDNSGGRVVIRGNDLRETRAQGVLIQTSHVVLEDNSIQGTGGPAIKLNLALDDWYEAINTNNVLIRDNTFARTSQSVAKTNDVIHVYQVDRDENPVDIIDGVIISGNELLDSHDTTPIDPPNLPAVELFYLNKEPNPLTSEIEAQVELYNRSDADFNFAGTEIRYLFDPDGLTPAISIVSTNAPSGGVTGDFNDIGGYASFVLNEDFLIAPDDRLKLRFVIANEENANFDQTNDASFIATQTTIDVTTSITVILPGSAPITVPLGSLGSGVAVDDQATGVGYVLHSAESVFTRFDAHPPHPHNSLQLISVRQQDGQWEYSENTQWYPLTIQAGDRLLAAIDFDAASITSLAGASGQLFGIDYGYLDGDLEFLADSWNGRVNRGEYAVTGTSFTVSAQPDRRAVVPLGQMQKGVAVADNATGAGYMLYSAEDLQSRFADQRPLASGSKHVVAVREQNGQWEYNNNIGWFEFMPRDSDVLLATIDLDADTVTSMMGQSGIISGIARGYTSGDVTYLANSWDGSFNRGEFEVIGTYFLK